MTSAVTQVVEVGCVIAYYWACFRFDRSLRDYYLEGKGFLVKVLDD